MKILVLNGPNINMLGIREGRHYPNEAFWKVAGEIGCDVIFGCDAHNPDSLARPADIDAAQALAARHGLRVIEPMEPVKFRG